MSTVPRRRTMAALALCVCLPLAGCGAEESPSGSDAGRDTTVQPTESTGSTPDETTAPTPGATSDPGTGGETAAPEGSVVDLALRDLADRLGIDVDAITVNRNDEVTWRDGSIGCAVKGRAYTMMLVAGHLVVLEAGGRTYEYHAAKAQKPFYCENPQPPLPA